MGTLTSKVNEVLRVEMKGLLEVRICEIIKNEMT